VQCTRCGTDNPDQAEFCLNCGAPFTLSCPRCGAALPLQARFCFRCGCPLEAGAIEQPDDSATWLRRLVPKEYAERLRAALGQAHDERRTVTILFSDIKGSTAMAEKLDPEDVKEIIDGAFEFLIAPIYRYEGTLTQLMGDAILAFFGAPIAHEDDPERACRAALEITAEARRYADKLEKERGIRGFNVRVGINTGLVVVGEVGSDLRMAYTAIGDAINLAARMETAAEPGTVLVTEATHKLVAPLFETKALGPLQVQGRTEPVEAFRVLGAKAASGKVRGIAGLESPLVGRQAELAALQEAFQRLKAGVGGIVTIVGEAGIGKSRLVAEVRKSVQEAQVRWAEGRCLSYGTSAAYLLWVDLLRSLMRLGADATAEAVDPGVVPGSAR
jgi:class 3 adenylate cyclase/ribosomal protein L40E